MAMDQQRLVSTRFPYLPIRLHIQQGGDSLESEHEALLDTGFTAELVIPRSLVTNGHRPTARMRVRLGDNSEVVAPIYLVSFSLGPFGPFSVTAIGLGDEVILGVGVMDRFTITLDHASQLVVEL